MSGSEILGITKDVSESDVSVVSVAGEIDMLSAPELAGHLDEVIARGVPVVVDLSGVSFIDSSGLRELHRAADAGRVVLVIDRGATIARVVELSGFGERATVCEDIASARHRIAGDS